MNKFTVHMVSWENSRQLLRSVRETVFMHEQGIPAELEWDGIDESCHHALALSEKGESIGCGRMTKDGHIGRMAVLRKWRGRKIGTVLLETLLEEARRQSCTAVTLSAQVQALPFYRRFGFVVEGDEFMDAGIPHRNMRLKF